MRPCLHFSALLQSVKTVSRLVVKLSKLTHLDISRNGYSEMPQTCSWPSTLRFLNISRTKLSTVTTCLPITLEVLPMGQSRGLLVIYLFPFSAFCPGLGFKLQQFKRVPFDPALPERSQSLRKQASEAARWLAVPQFRVLVNTGQN